MDYKTVSLVPEFELLVKLSRVYDGNNVFPMVEVEKLLAECDFDLFQQRLNQARTWPLVYHNVKRFSVSLPENIQQLLKNKSHLVVRQNLQHKALLIQIQKEFELKEIPCIFLKGVMLTERLMGDISLRHSSDIDLLVQPKQLFNAQELLVNMGFKCLDIEYVNEFELEWQKKIYNHIQYQHLKTGFLVELHWRLNAYNEAFFLPELFWEKYKVIGKGSLHLLADDELFLYLCFHGGLHLWQRLKWLVDVEILMSQKNWDWSALLDKSFQYGCDRFLVLAVLLVHKLYNHSVPLVIEQYVKKQRSINRQVKKIIKLSFGLGHFAVNDSLGGYKGVFYMLFDVFFYKTLLFSGLKNRFKVVCHPLHPRLTDIHICKLPRKLFFIYYIIRPCRVAFEVFNYGGLKRIMKSKESA